MKKEDIIKFLNENFDDGENVPDEVFENNIMIDVVPHPYINEGSCKVYKPDGSFLCICYSELMFMDILWQIKKNRLEGYYAVKNNITYKINSNGFVENENNPRIFTKYEFYMKELMGF